MKKITMTFSVFVDDEPTTGSGDTVSIDQATCGLYEHICEWEFNAHGTVEIVDIKILDNAVIGVD
jgi:hypothetical protein